jgi:hypothetical protein
MLALPIISLMPCFKKLSQNMVIIIKKRVGCNIQAKILSLLFLVFLDNNCHQRAWLIRNTATLIQTPT